VIVAQPSRSFGRHALHVVLMLVVFAIIGPPVGYLVFLAGMFVLASLEAPVFFDNAFSVFVVGVPFSYLVGVLPALVVGLAAAIGQVLFRSFGAVHAAALSTVPAAAWIVSSLKASRSGDQVFSFAVVVVFIFVISALVCWYVTLKLPTRE
jgi:hypothetical protein